MTTIYRETTDVKDQNLPEKIFYNYRYKGGTAKRQVGEMTVAIQLRATAVGGQTTNGRRAITAEIGPWE